MTPEQFEQYVDQHPEVSWVPARLSGDCVEAVELADATGLAFRVDGVSWYSNPKNVSYLSAEKTGDISQEELHALLTRGLDMEQITRITGYFTKVSSWNAGKRAELGDRYRNPAFVQSC